jgi:hypothetical protein
MGKRCNNKNTYKSGIKGKGSFTFINLSLSHDPNNSILATMTASLYRKEEGNNTTTVIEKKSF